MKQEIKIETMNTQRAQKQKHEATNPRTQWQTHEPSSKPTNPSNKTYELRWRTHERRWRNPQTHARIEPMNLDLPNPNPLARIELGEGFVQRFSSSSGKGFIFLCFSLSLFFFFLFLICAKQELESIIHEFHATSWKSSFKDLNCYSELEFKRLELLVS